MTLNLRSDFGNSRQDFEFDRVIAPRAKRGIGTSYPDPGLI